MRRLLSLISGPLLLLGCGQPRPAGGDAPDSIVGSVEKQRYVFVAQTAIPAGGRTIQLTTPYDLRVMPDSLVAFLPYFGRAFTAPIGQTGQGIQFTSTRFEYEKQNKRRNTRLITIKPNDVDEIQQMFLSISSNGTASLQVTSTNRQPITFNGIVRESR